MTAFYTNYVALCAKVGKSPSAVAEEIGLSRTSPNGWKKGKLPRDATLAKLADYFHISVAELLSENENKPAPMGSEPLSLDYMRTLSAEQLLQLMKDATQALSEKQ